MDAFRRELVASRHLAVVRERRAWSQLGGQLLPLLDRVYAAVGDGRIAKAGHNVFVYRDAAPDGVTVEVGIEVAAPFTDFDGIVSSSTPAGDVATTVHVGPYAKLGTSYDALARWCDANGLTRAGVWWEVYGDSNDDSARLQTELFQLLRP